MKHTPEEKAVLDLLSSAWNAFVKLPIQHPDEVHEFRFAMHVMQGIMATRLARQADPETWPTHSP